MGARILRTSDLEDLAVMVADLVAERMAVIERAETLPAARAEAPESDQAEEVDWGFEGDSADAQENGQPAQADAQPAPDPEPVAEAPTPAPAKTAKAKGKGQTDLLGLGDEEDDE